MKVLSSEGAVPDGRCRYTRHPFLSAICGGNDGRHDDGARMRFSMDFPLMAPIVVLWLLSMSFLRVSVRILAFFDRRQLTAPPSSPGTLPLPELQLQH